MSAPISFAFAEIVTGRLVRHPRRKQGFVTARIDDYGSFWEKAAILTGITPADWVALAPRETPIPFDPDDPYHFWQNHGTEPLPRVEHNAGYWRHWTGGAPPPTAGVGKMIFLVLEEEYERLSEARDELTELREMKFHARPERAPSSGASPSQFLRDQSEQPLEFGRPVESEKYPVPLSLLQPEFGQFQEDLLNAPLDPSLSPLAWKWREQLSDLFGKEVQREGMISDLLGELFGEGVTIRKISVGDYENDGGARIDGLNDDLFGLPVILEVKSETTCGTADGVFEVLLYYDAITRRLAVFEKSSGNHHLTRLPALLILHNGPNIQVFGAACLDYLHAQVLSPSVPLYFNRYDWRAMENLTRFMVALRNLFNSLRRLYLDPAPHTVPPDQITFPYVRSYTPIRLPGEEDHPDVSFCYLKRIDDLRLVFEAVTKTDSRIIVKFGCNSYGRVPHVDAAAAGITSRLLSHAQMPGEMWVVVMEPLASDFICCGTFHDHELPQEAIDAIRKTMDKFHDLGYVHGDPRASNFYVRKVNGVWECQLIDMDWAGLPGEAKYPQGVYSGAVFRPERFMDGMEITKEHDLLTLHHWTALKGPNPRWRD